MPLVKLGAPPFLSPNEVENDMLRRGTIESEIGFTPPDDLKDYYVGAIAEIEDL